MPKPSMTWYRWWMNEAEDCFSKYWLWSDKWKVGLPDSEYDWMADTNSYDYVFEQIWAMKEGLA